MRSPTASKWDFGNCEPGNAGDSGLKGVLLPVLCLRLGRALVQMLTSLDLGKPFKGLAEAGYWSKYVIWIIRKRETGLKSEREA